MIGASHEEVGMDSGTTTHEIRRLAQHAVQVFPQLSGLQLVRCWGSFAHSHSGYKACLCGIRKLSWRLCRHFPQRYHFSTALCQHNSKLDH